MGQRRILIGLLFVGGSLLCGLAALVVGTRTANRIEGLESLTAAALRASQPGQEVLIEGHVSADNAIRQQSYGFVAYLRETRSLENDEGEEEPGEWRLQETVTPPFLLELSGSPVQIVNDDYDLRDANVVEVDPGVHRYSDTRYKGLLPGDEILVVGTAGPAGEVLQIQAEFVARGTQESYAASQRNAGWIFVVVSVVVALIGGVLLLRR